MSFAHPGSIGGATGWPDRSIGSGAVVLQCLLMPAVLAETHEALAREVAALVEAYDQLQVEFDDRDEDVPAAERDRADSAMRAIGTRLNDEGGFSLMQAVGHRAVELGCLGRSVECWWDGIGSWEA
jgi:hypothetical protein